MCMKSRQPMEEIWKPKVRTCREGHFCCPHLSWLYIVGVLSHVWFFATPWSVPTRLLCPWDFPGKNTGVGCHFLLWRIFLTQGLNPCLLHKQADSLPRHHLGSPSLLFFILYETPSTPSTNDIYSEYLLSKLWVKESLHNSIDGLGPHVGMILTFPSEGHMLSLEALGLTLSGSRSNSSCWDLAALLSELHRLRLTRWQGREDDVCR